jgi:hypothetical protein
LRRGAGIGDKDVETAPRLFNLSAKLRGGCGLGQIQGRETRKTWDPTCKLASRKSSLTAR